MRILIPTIGTYSDLQPYLPLASGLQCAGHEVIVATHPTLCEVVESYGVEFVPVGSDIDLTIETAEIHRNSRNQIQGSTRVMKLLLKALEQAHDDLLELCRWSDWVIVSHNAAGSIEADQLDRPTISVTLMPQEIAANDPTRSSQKHVTDNSASMPLSPMTPQLNQIRKRIGIGPMGRTGFTSSWLNLIPVSPRVVAPDPCWEPRHRMTGYWFDPEPRDQQPSETLMKFLAKGSKPVVINLGAVNCDTPDSVRIAYSVIKAIEQAGIHATIHGWEPLLRDIPLRDTILSMGSVPTNWLLQQASGTVSNGDFSAVASGLQAGIPSLVIPFSTEQLIWGSRIQEMGIGPAPLPECKLTIESLQDTLLEMADNDAMRKRACAIGKQVCSEHGLENALRLIDIAFWAVD